MRNRNPSIDWHAIHEFDLATVPPALRHTALHEAAHFLAAVHYKIPVHGVYIKVPSASNSPLAKNASGAVMTWDEPIAGDIVCTLAGTIVDLKILGPERVLEDCGFRHDIDHAREIIRSAVRDPSYSSTGLYVSQNHVLTEEELQALTSKFCVEAKALIECHWGVLETLAAAIIVCAARSTGRLHSSKVEKLYGYTRGMLKDCPPG